MSRTLASSLILCEGSENSVQLDQTGKAGILRQYHLPPSDSRIHGACSYGSRVHELTRTAVQIQGGDPTGTGSGGTSFWGANFRDETDIKGAYKHDARGVLVRHDRG